MGLDMFLLMKKEGVNQNGVLGCCDGDLPFGLKTETQEIGYWRKAYDVNEAILRTIAPNVKEDNCVQFPVSYEHIESLLKLIDGILINDDESDDWNSWTCDDELEDWRDAKKFFEKAKEILKEDKTVSIYYMTSY